VRFGLILAPSCPTFVTKLSKCRPHDLYYSQFSDVGQSLDGRIGADCLDFVVHQLSVTHHTIMTINE